MRKTVSKEFRDLFEKEYPNLNKDIRFWKLMRILLFAFKQLDKGTIIPEYVLAKIEDKLSQLNNKNYNGSILLEQFQQEVMNESTFYWTDWSYTKHLARVAYPIFPIHIQEAIDNELYKQVIVDRVYFTTGKIFSLKQQRIEREDMRKEAMINSLIATEAKDLLNYMNNLPPNMFIKIVNKNMNNAVLEAFNITNKETREHQLRVLSSIKDDIQPFYQPSKNNKTVRIFPTSESILLLKKNIRKALCKGWYDFDLASSQLAIVATTWDIQYVRDYLLQNNNIWQDLLSCLNINNNQDYEVNKKYIKTCLYSLIYGMTKKNLITRLDYYFGPTNGALFFNHPIIKCLYTARQKRIAYINKQGYITTIFNKRIVISSNTKQRAADIRSALAEEAQAIELYLLLPVIDLAKTTKDFSINLFQHDGFTVSFSDKSKVNYWTNKIKQVVNDKANQLSIPTHLEVEIL